MQLVDWGRRLKGDVCFGHQPNQTRRDGEDNADGEAPMVRGQHDRLALNEVVESL